MTFVFTSWYFVILALVAGIAASLIIFLKMDKKDRILIDEFVKENQPKEEVEQPENKSVESKVE